MILRSSPSLLLLASPLAAQGRASIDYAKLRDETAQRLSEYIRINTSNPPGNELATARWLARRARQGGDPGEDPRHGGAGAGRANFYARLPGTGAGRAIALVHHMDVVRPRRRTGRSIRSPGRSRTATSGAGARWT